MITSLILSAAFAANTQPMWDKSERENTCSSFHQVLDGWWAGKEGEATLTEEQIPQALGMLKQMEFPTDKELNEIDAALKKDLASNLPKFLKIANSSCLQVRVRVGNALINASEKYPAHKAEIVGQLKTVLMKPKYRTFLEAAIDTSLMKKGAEKKLWMLGNELTTVDATMKADREKFQKKYNPAWEKLAQGGQVEADALTKELKKSKQLPLIKESIELESAKSKTYLASIKKLASAIKSGKKS